MNSVTLILLGSLTVTAYRPVAEQTKPECTNRDHCHTSIDENTNELGVAASQDLIKSGRLHYHDVIWIPGIGYRIVFDTMNARHKNSIDVFVYSKDEERKMGTRHLNVYRLTEPK